MTGVDDRTRDPIFSHELHAAIVLVANASTDYSPSHVQGQARAAGAEWEVVSASGLLRLVSTTILLLMDY